MSRKVMNEFLKELESLEEKYGLYISGYGCCGSPVIKNEEGNTIADELEFEDGEYTVSLFLKYFGEAEISNKNPQELPEILRD